MVNETISYDYHFSTTKINFNRKAQGFSLGVHGMIVWNENLSTSLGIVYNQTSGNNHLITNLLSYYSGTTPISTKPREVFYADINKALQIPLLFDYQINTVGKIMPYFMAGFTYYYSFKKPHNFLIELPEERFPIYTTIAAGVLYKPRGQNLYLLQGFLNYDFFKTEYFTNYRVYQVGLQLRLMRSRYAPGR